MSPIGFAILGAGIFAKEAHLPAIAKLQSYVELKAVYSRSLKSAQELASEAKVALNTSAPPSVYHDGGDSSTSIDALLKRPDIVAVIVVLPILTQPEIIIKALAAGKHVLSEKPVAKDVATGLKLIKEYEAVYKSKNLIWRVAENFEAEPGFQKAGELIRGGKIGEVQHFRLQAMNNIDKTSKWYNTDWRKVPEYQGGFLLDGGVHSAALLRVLVGELTYLSAFSSLKKDYLLPEDTINAIIKSKGGADGVFELGFGCPGKGRSSDNTTIITGSKGWITVGGAQVKEGGSTINVTRITITTVKTDKDDVDLEENVETIDEVQRGVEAEIESFCQAISGKDDGLGAPFEALKDVAIIEAAIKSQGSLIDLKKYVSA